MGVWDSPLPAVLESSSGSFLAVMMTWCSHRIVEVRLWGRVGSSEVGPGYCIALISAGPFGLADFPLPQLSGPYQQCLPSHDGCLDRRKCRSVSPKRLCATHLGTCQDCHIHITLSGPYEVGLLLHS